VEKYPTKTMLGVREIVDGKVSSVFLFHFCHCYCFCLWKCVITSVTLFCSLASISGKLTKRFTTWWSRLEIPFVLVVMGRWVTYVLL